MEPLTKKDILKKLNGVYISPLAEKFLASGEDNILLGKFDALNLEDKLLILRIYGDPMIIDRKINIVTPFILFMKDYGYALPNLLQKVNIRITQESSTPYSFLDNILNMTPEGLQVSALQQSSSFESIMSLLKLIEEENTIITNKKLISMYIKILYYFSNEQKLDLVNNWLKSRQKVLEFMTVKRVLSKFISGVIIERTKIISKDEWLQKDTSEKQAIRVQLAKEEQTENSSERTSAYFAYQQKYIDLVNAIDQYLKSDNSLSSLKNDFDLLNQQEFGLLDLSDAFSPAKNMGSLWLGSEEANKIPTLKNLIELYEELWNYRLFYPLDRVNYIDEIASEADQLLS